MAKRFMRDRKPLNVRPFAMAHNLLMAALSLYMVVETLSQVSSELGGQQVQRRTCLHWGNCVKLSMAHNMLMDAPVYGHCDALESLLEAFR